MSEIRVPSVQTLWNGAVLGGIANAVMTAVDPAFAPYKQWIRNSYIANPGDGREGIVTFVGGHWYAHGPLIGVFYSPESPRSSMGSSSGWEVAHAFRGTSQYQRDLADQAALSYLQLEVSGHITPRITAAFWDDGCSLASADSWDLLLQHGADVVADELIDDLDQSMVHARVNYGMTDAQAELIWSLFQQKSAHPPRRIAINQTQADWIRTQSASTDSLKLCRQMLREMCIDMPAD